MTASSGPVGRSGGASQSNLRARNPHIGWCAGLVTRAGHNADEGARSRPAGREHLSIQRRPRKYPSLTRRLFSPDLRPVDNFSTVGPEMPTVPVTWSFGNPVIRDPSHLGTGSVEQEATCQVYGSPVS